MTVDEMPHDLCVEPETKDCDDLVYSKTKLVGPNSFMSETVLLNNLNGDAPPPTYTKYE